METNTPRPRLEYLAGPPFGWREEEGSLVLALPPRPTWEVAAESSSILTASTGFLLIYGVVAFFVGRRVAADSERLQAMLVVVGLLAIGQWVLVVMRVGSMLRMRRTAGRITVTPNELIASDALPPGPTDNWWPREEIAAVRLEVVGGLWGKLRRVRLQVATHSGTVSSCTFVWPAQTPSEPYTQRLREALALPARSTN